MHSVKSNFMHHVSYMDAVIVILDRKAEKQPTE